MVFMDPLKIQCEDCKGKKFKKDILKVKLKDKNIYELLNVTVAQAFDFFQGLCRSFKGFKLSQ